MVLFHGVSMENSANIDLVESGVQKIIRLD